MYWFVAIDVLGDASGIGPLLGQGHPTCEICKWFSPLFFFLYDVYVLKWFTYDDILLNLWWMMKWRWSVWLNSWWLSKWLWNVDRVLYECWNDDENVNILKWPI